MATFCGSGLYVIGMSKSDQRKNLRGSRQWYWTKDVNASNSNCQIYDNDIRYICDVDYYLDMPDLLVKETKPILLYTVVPETAVSVSEDDTSFYFNRQGELETFVAGSGKYKHSLWDYAHDSLLAVKRNVMGFPTKAVAFSIERKQVGKHRQLILLTPIREFGLLTAALATYLLEHVPLKRFNPITRNGVEEFVRFNVHTSGETLVTIARPSTWACATVPASVDDGIATVARLSTTKLMLPTTASWLGKGENDDDRLRLRVGAAVLTDYHRSGIKNIAPTVYPVARAVRAYQYKPSTFDQEARPKLEAFMSPLVHGAFTPIFNKAGEEQCVDGRINKLKGPEPKPHRFTDECIEEFAQLVVGFEVLAPSPHEVLAEKQKRASQVLSLLRAVLMGPYRDRKLKCHGKGEAYGDVKDPRNISEYNDGDKLDMGKIATALSAYLKRFAWYGPGKTPEEIAQRVVDCLANATFANVSDFERMDGTITHKIREVDRAVCMKAFANNRAEVNEILKTNVNNKGYLPQGTTFEQGPSHGSGCSATSVFQTLRAAYCSYLAYRRTTKSNGAFYSPEEAFEKIGIHTGDDGLDPDLPVNNHKWAAEKLGLRLEACVVNRGHRGVNFLARYYSAEVWTGSPNSMCDVKRQLAKFHTTLRLPENVKAEAKLVEKAMSYVATDGNTPVIGELCKKVLLLSDYRPSVPLGVGTWWGKFEQSCQYPNENVGGWMDVEFETLFPEFDRSLFTNWLDSIKQATQLLSPPLCAEPKPATATVVDVVVDGDVLFARRTDPESKQPEGPQVKTTTTMRRTPRPKQVKSGKCYKKVTETSNVRPAQK